MLNTKEAYKSIAAYIAMNRFKSFFGGSKKKGFMMKAAGKFKTYKQDKVEQFSGAAKKGKQSTDRLKKDKQFLSKLTDVQTLVPSKKYKERRIHKEAKEVLDFLEGRQSFWSQMNM